MSCRISILFGVKLQTQKLITVFVTSHAIGFTHIRARSNILHCEYTTPFSVTRRKAHKVDIIYNYSTGRLLSTCSLPQPRRSVSTESVLMNVAARDF